MKYKFEVEVPYYEQRNVTTEMLEEEAVRHLSIALKPLISLKRVDEAFLKEELMYRDIRMRAEASLYAYHSHHMDHIIKMLHALRLSANPVQAGGISQVIDELTHR